MEIIEKYPDKQWNWKGISRNPNLTMEMIEKNPDKPWDWQLISQNNFKKDKENFIKEKIKQYFKDNIYEQLIQKVFHPNNIDKFEDWGY